VGRLGDSGSGPKGLPARLDKVRTNAEQILSEGSSRMGLVRDQRPALLTARAQRLRRHDTDAEARLWNALRDRRLGGWRWRRQTPFGPFVLDFLCREAALVVELDGGQHADRAAYDARRTVWLERHGLRVIRFWNNQVLECRADVCDAILHACGGETSPPPAKRRGRG